jgi:putative photosynthetic complex assembly protein
MVERHDPHHVPRAPLVAGGVLAVATLALVSIFRIAGGTPAAASLDASTVAAHDLRFEDRDDGSIAVINAASGAVLDTFAAGTNGFLRGTLRALAHERHRTGLGSQPPFRIVKFSDGRLALEDPSVGNRIYLDAFGATNAAPFDHLYRLASLSADRASP